MSEGTAVQVEDGGSASIRLERRGALALFELDRPAKRNALTIDARSRIARALPDYARDPMVYVVGWRSRVDGAFSSGGDIVEMTALARQDLEAARAALWAETSLCWLAECFSKPTVAIIDGPVMGGGNAVVARGTHRVAGPRYAFSMPETAIGFVPNCGMTYNFSRMPGELGVYLALTGQTIGRADAYRLGLVTHCIDAPHYDPIWAELADAEPVDPVLDQRHVDPGGGELRAHAPAIARCFGAGTVEEIFERLAREEAGNDGAWASATRSQLLKRAPLALKVAHRLLREASSIDLRELLELEYRVTSRFLELPDLHEGVRALLVEKDLRPAWQPAKLADVTPAMVEALFSSETTIDASLATREQMQAARV